MDRLTSNFHKKVPLLIKPKGARVPNLLILLAQTRYMVFVIRYKNVAQTGRNTQYDQSGTYPYVGWPGNSRLFAEK